MSHDVTCRTAGCRSEGKTRSMTLSWVDEESGETVTVSAVYCGSCSQRIEDISPPLGGEPEPASVEAEPASDTPDPADSTEPDAS